jgi:hypothetical protein
MKLALSPFFKKRMSCVLFSIAIFSKLQNIIFMVVEQRKKAAEAAKSFLSKRTR